MTSPVFGEFVGTAVLVLLGDGVVGGGVAAWFESSERGMDGDHGRMGVRGVCGCDHRRGLRQPERGS